MRDRAGLAGPRPLPKLEPVRLRLLQGTIAIVLGFVTVALVVDQRLYFGLDARRLDLVLSTISGIVALAVAVLGFVRSREARDAAALYDGAAFLLLAIANGTHVAVIVAGAGDAVGLDRDAPHAAPLYVGALVRVVSAALLVAGAWRHLRQRRFTGLQRLTVMVLPTLVVALLTIGIVASRRPLIHSSTCRPTARQRPRVMRRPSAALPSLPSTSLASDSSQSQPSCDHG